MYRVLVLTTVFLVAVWADTDDDMKKCMRIIHPSSHHCCVRDHPPKPPKRDDSGMKECMQIQGKPPSCDRDICFATKHGYASADGKIDKAALEAVLESDFEDNPELLKMIKENCVEGDLSKYGKADMCDLKKLKICIDVQLAKSCPKWDDDGPCAGIKELAEECLEKFA